MTQSPAQLGVAGTLVAGVFVNLATDGGSGDDTVQLRSTHFAAIPELGRARTIRRRFCEGRVRVLIPKIDDAGSEPPAQVGVREGAPTVDHAEQVLAGQHPILGGGVRRGILLGPCSPGDDRHLQLEASDHLPEQGVTRQSLAVG